MNNDTRYRGTAAYLTMFIDSHFERGDYVTQAAVLKKHLRNAGWKPDHGGGNFIENMEALGFERFTHHQRNYWRGIRPLGEVEDKCPVCGRSS